MIRWQFRLTTTLVQTIPSRTSRRDRAPAMCYYGQRLDCLSNRQPISDRGRYHILRGLPHRCATTDDQSGNGDRLRDSKLSSPPVNRPGSTLKEGGDVFALSH